MTLGSFIELLYINIVALVLLLELKYYRNGFALIHTLQDQN